jgi:hypothetical protein
MEAGNPVNPHYIAPFDYRARQAFVGIVEQTLTHFKATILAHNPKSHQRSMNL